MPALAARQLLRAREQIRDTRGAGSRRVDDHRRAHIEALAGDPILRDHAGECSRSLAAARQRRVVRDGRPRALRVVQHGVHESLGRIELGVVEERAARMVFEQPGDERAQLRARERSALAAIRRDRQTAIVAVSRHQVVERERRAHEQRGFATRHRASAPRTTSGSTEMRRDPEPRAPLAHEARAPGGHRVDCSDRSPPCTILRLFQEMPPPKSLPFDQRHPQPAPRRISRDAGADDPAADDQHVERGSPASDSRVALHAAKLPSAAPRREPAASAARALPLVFVMRAPPRCAALAARA